MIYLTLTRWETKPTSFTSITFYTRIIQPHGKEHKNISLSTVHWAWGNSWFNFYFFESKCCPNDKMWLLFIEIVHYTDETNRAWQTYEDKAFCILAGSNFSVHSQLLFCCPITSCSELIPFQKLLLTCSHLLLHKLPQAMTSPSAFGGEPLNWLHQKNLTLFEK